jgi:hypothetical protein
MNFEAIFCTNKAFMEITGKIKSMDPKICKTLAQSINALCLSEEKADVHFKLPISMKKPKVTKVLYFIYIFASLEIKYRQTFINTLSLKNL